MTDPRIDISAPVPTPIPRQARLLKKIIDPCYRFFDWLYGSELNPLYRSGTLAVGFLLVLLVTGLYLCFFYSVSQPYESLAALNQQVWLGRWIRTLHRYTTVATVAAILFHILQLLVQGKSWGPRTLAWISGVVLLAMYLLSAWSGYVMVWDRHGQRVAMAGAELLAIFPMLREVVTAAFDGTAEIPPGFFFMNLFLHVALPLVMIMALWIHTARLSRAVWLPKRSIMIGSVFGLAALAVVWPAPLLEKADPLKLVGRMPTDISTGFWMSWIESFGALPTLGTLIGALAVLAVIPWWWRPASEEQRPISVVDLARCTGCTQCTRDCPYEAIKMVPRSDGKRLVAEIISPHCVSCGICAASCADFAIGPPGRAATDQQARAQDFCKEAQRLPEPIELVLISCANNPGLSGLLSDYQNAQRNVALYPVECCGCVHSDVLEQLLKVSKGCAMIGCPARNCFNRDGGELLAQRIFEKRVPFLDRSIDRSRIWITSFSEAEGSQLRDSLLDFRSRLAGTAADSRSSVDWRKGIRSTLVSIALLCLCAYAAQLPNGTDPTSALIRVAGTLPSSAAERCHTPTAEEVGSLPQHMRPKEICERIPLQYVVTISADGSILTEQAVRQRSGRVDQPLFLDIEAALAPGQHRIEITIESGASLQASCQAEINLAPGEIFLAHYKRHEALLSCKA